MSKPTKAMKDIAEAGKKNGTDLTRFFTRAKVINPDNLSSLVKPPVDENFKDGSSQ